MTINPTENEMKIPIPPVEAVGSEWLDRSFGLSIMPSRRTRYVAHTDTQKRAIANSKCVTNTMVAIGIHLTEEANESGHIVETQDVPTQLTAGDPVRCTALLPSHAVGAWAYGIRVGAGEGVTRL